ncbi:VanW family protein [Clostridium tarantellae]|uniref:G5 domain-containing protein n=1 Tax=Clostridium tarantellae TaxID=39493 RepID=A0A6I1MI11_9CLOT|nr:VanW family protein [Clostridium tarantellae]MPQ43186.1 hypothetical protein [Clostridium tarantellae]
MSDKRSDKFLSSKTNKIILSVVIGGALVIGGGALYYSNIKNNVSKWQDKIYPGTMVEGVDLSNKTKEEAVQLLHDNYGKAVLEKEIVVKAADKEMKISYEELSPQYNIEEAVNEALAYGKDKNVFEQNAIINSGSNKNFTLKFKYNEEKLADYENKFKEMVNADAKNATINIDGGNIDIVDGKEGRKVNEEEMIKLIKESINGSLDKKTEVIVPIEVTKPSINRDQLTKIDGKIASFTSDYAHNSTNNRAINVEIATNAINGTLLMPGETFSYNDIVGERTAARGFKNAATFVGDKVEDGIGGGICQVSTALYRAMMRAGIKSVQRSNHSMKTSYSPVGLDAVVAWGYLDYKFKNTYDFPIYIEGITTPDRKIVFDIYGNTADMDGKTYELIAGPVKKIEPSIKKVNDPNLPKGKEEWEKKPITGYNVSSYLITYKNGVEVDKQFIATDNYLKSDGVLKVGAMEAIPIPVPAPAPTPVQPINPEVKPEHENNQQSRVSPQ